MDVAALPRRRVFPALALGTVMPALDISVVNIALPTRTFGVPLSGRGCRAIRRDARRT